jgi:general stress protein YciG
VDDVENSVINLENINMSRASENPDQAGAGVAIEDEMFAQEILMKIGERLGGASAKKDEGELVVEEFNADQLQKSASGAKGRPSAGLLGS